MFDCPPAIHTSPTRTFFIIFDSSPFSKTERFRLVPLASIGLSRASQSPFSDALIFDDCPPKRTSTSAFGSAVPQIFTGICRWSTMLSEKTFGISIFADKSADANRPAIKTSFFFIVFPSFILNLSAESPCMPAQRFAAPAWNFARHILRIFLRN